MVVNGVSVDNNLKAEGSNPAGAVNYYKYMTLMSTLITRTLLFDIFNKQDVINVKLEAVRV